MADTSAVGLSRLMQETPEVPPETSVISAVKIMSAKGIGALAVTRERKIVGVFTERDLMKRVVLEGRDPNSTLLRDVMSSPVVEISESTSVGEAAAIMRTHHIRHLAVVDENGYLVGLVALRYLLYDLLGALENKVEDLHQFIMADGPGG